MWQRPGLCKAGGFCARGFSLAATQGCAKREKFVLVVFLGRGRAPGPYPAKSRENLWRMAMESLQALCYTKDKESGSIQGVEKEAAL